MSGLLTGLALTACIGPKSIGDESDTNINEPQCTDGEMKDADDGCNTCTCVDGSWACTEKGCADEDAPPAECMDGEMKEAEDGCNQCSCYMGAWACTQIGCDPTVVTSGGEAVCGDGIVQPPEICDDGNAVDNDACPNDCGVDGTTGDATTAGNETDTATSGEDPGVCGDGIVSGAEPCDDGNFVDGDGCSANCQLEGGACADKPKDLLTIQDVTIEGDTLVVDVTYGGGCETHDIDYCWDGSFAESDPVQTWISLWHDGHGDACDALIEEKKMLDLTPMKQAWQDGYQMTSGKILLHLNGWPSVVEYSF